jgi:hypothetical protein
MSLDGKPLVEGVAEKLQTELDNQTLVLGSGDTLSDGWNTFKYRKTDGTFTKDDETGQEIATTLPMNFKAYWDGDLLSELVDNVTISKYNWEDKCVDILYEAFGCASNSGTKAVPCLVGDIFGDWREEIIWRDGANTELRIYATPYETEYKIPTLMHDITYREAVAWQNNHYNQPTNTSFYFGAETTSVPAPEIKTTSGKVNPDLAAASTEHLDLPILTQSNNSPSADNSVILKIGSSNAVANGTIKAIDSENSEVVPIITPEDRTIVPLRFISENFGAKVDWNGDTREVTITLDNTEIKMTVDSTVYTVNGEEKTLDAPAQIYNDNTMVPVRAVLESLSKELYWDGDNQLVIIGDGVANADDATVSSWISAAAGL